MGQARVARLVHGVLVVDLLVLPQILAVRIHLARHATLSVYLFREVRGRAVHVEVVQVLHVLLALHLVRFAALGHGAGWIGVD